MKFIRTAKKLAGPQDIVASQTTSLCSACKFGLKSEVLPVWYALACLDAHGLKITSMDEDPNAAHGLLHVDLGVDEFTKDKASVHAYNALVGWLNKKFAG